MINAFIAKAAAKAASFSGISTITIISWLSVGHRCLGVVVGRSRAIGEQPLLSGRDSCVGRGSLTI
jgi:hypothetical protein